MRQVVFACVLGAVVVGCGKKRVAPGPDQTVQLAGKTATWHDWQKTNVCDVEELRVEGDFTSMKELLLSALGQTSASYDGAWADENLAILDAMPKQLPPALASLEKGVADAAQCKWTEQSKVPELLQPLGELVAQAKRKIDGAPGLAAKVRAYQALKVWRDKQPAAKDEARKNWCPAKPKAGAQPDIFYAYEDENGHAEWLFCDDSKVIVAKPGDPPVFDAAATYKKKPKDKPYLDEAAKYPAGDIQKAPKSEQPAAPKKEEEEKI
ncbi:MAG: hypothetical protein QM723_34910 [Myxococcaceae bacterium]